MTQATLFLYVGEVIGCLLFCILYASRSKFWQTAMGWNMLAMMFVLFVLQTLPALRFVGAENWLTEHGPAIRFWSFFILFIVVWWRVAILITVQHEEHKPVPVESEPFREPDDTDPNVFERSNR